MASGLWIGPHMLGQSQADQLVPVAMLTTAGALTTGVASPTIQISKNGAAFASPADGTWTEIASGYYTITLDDDDTDTEGWIIIRINKTGCNETAVHCWVGLSVSEWARMGLQLRTLHREGK